MLWFSTDFKIKAAITNPVRVLTYSRVAPVTSGRDLCQPTVTWDVSSAKSCFVSSRFTDFSAKKKSSSKWKWNRNRRGSNMDEDGLPIVGSGVDLTKVRVRLANVNTDTMRGNQLSGMNPRLFGFNGSGRTFHYKQHVGIVWNLEVSTWQGFYNPRFLVHYCTF